MIKRAIILEAAARVFGDHGYRGATTRLIAREAGVSEVTLFRVFGTKDALLRQALGSPSRRARVEELPETPGNVERELADWCAAYLRRLRAGRKVIRKSLGEAADRPSVARRAVELPTAASRMLRDYLEKASRLRVLPPHFDVTAAATVLTGVLFADAIGRDLMPGDFPQPARDAHKLYVNFVLGRDAARTSQVEQRARAAPERRSRSPLGAAQSTVFDRRRSTGAEGRVALARDPVRRGRGKA